MTSSDSLFGSSDDEESEEISEEVEVSDKKKKEHGSQEEEEDVIIDGSKKYDGKFLQKKVEKEGEEAKKNGMLFGLVNVPKKKKRTVTFEELLDRVRKVEDTLRCDRNKRFDHLDWFPYSVRCFCRHCFTTVFYIAIVAALAVYLFFRYREYNDQPTLIGVTDEEIDESRMFPWVVYCVGKWQYSGDLEYDRYSLFENFYVPQDTRVDLHGFLFSVDDDETPLDCYSLASPEKDLEKMSVDSDISMRTNTRNIWSSTDIEDDPLSAYFHIFYDDQITTEEGLEDHIRQLITDEGGLRKEFSEFALCQSGIILFHETHYDRLDSDDDEIEIEYLLQNGINEFSEVEYLEDDETYFCYTKVRFESDGSEPKEFREVRSIGVLEPVTSAAAWLFIILILHYILSCCQMCFVNSLNSTLWKLIRTYRRKTQIITEIDFGSEEEEEKEEKKEEEMMVQDEELETEM